MSNDGGPAFPWQISIPTGSINPITGRPVGEPTVEVFGGMTIRDYFAAKAMSGWLASYGPETPHPACDTSSEDLAKLSYKLADAMLAARGGSK